MGMKAINPATKFVNTKRQVRLVPDVDFGPFEVTAKSDEAAAHFVAQRHVKPLINAGAIKEMVWAVCGDAKVLARC